MQQTTTHICQKRLQSGFDTTLQGGLAQQAHPQWERPGPGSVDIGHRRTNGDEDIGWPGMRRGVHGGGLVGPAERARRSAPRAT